MLTTEIASSCNSLLHVVHFSALAAVRCLPIRAFRHSMQFAVRGTSLLHVAHFSVQVAVRCSTQVAVRSLPIYTFRCSTQFAVRLRFSSVFRISHRSRQSFRRAPPSPSPQFQCQLPVTTSPNQHPHTKNSIAQNRVVIEPQTSPNISYSLSVDLLDYLKGGSCEGAFTRVRGWGQLGEVG